MKVLFMHIKGSGISGVWFVNKMLAEALVNKGYDVEFLFIRSHDTSKKVVDDRIKINVINEKIKWETKHIQDLKNHLVNKKINLLAKDGCVMVNDKLKLKKDFIKTKNKIKEINPDVIITSHYQVLDAIPKEYLSRVLNVQHSSFLYAQDKKKNFQTFKKYNGKITNAWLCKNSRDKAIGCGLTNNTYVYNPVKLQTSKNADVVNNKKLVTISRLSSVQKRIDLMVRICDKVLKKNKDWVLELYGPGELDKESMDIIRKNKQIKLMGPTDNVKEALLSSSIYLSTSYTEGFALSLLEANECGVPVVSYDFGESCSEQIPNDCGIIVDFDDSKTFEKELNDLMNDKKRLQKYAKASKKFAQQFHIENVVEEWSKLFDKVTKKND